MSRTKPKSDPFKDLTWDDLEDWAGAAIVSRGRSYHRDGLVKDLARTADGDLVAWVLGTKEYATQVEMDDGELSSSCTCPYDGACKHAVAVVLAYLDLLKQGKDPQSADERDERLSLLVETGDEDDWDDEADETDDEELPAALRSSGRHSPKPRWLRAANSYGRRRRCWRTNTNSAGAWRAFGKRSIPPRLGASWRMRLPGAFRTVQPARAAPIFRGNTGVTA